MADRALFFLRHFNDIDSIVPIIQRWATRHNVPTTVVVTNGPAILQDFRLKLLSSFPQVSIKLTSSFDKRLSKELFEPKGFWARARLLARGLWPHRRNKSEQLDTACRSLAELIVGQVFQDADRGLIAFDWISDNMGSYLHFARAVAEQARNRNLRIISLPHGDEPHACKMTRIDEINYRRSDIYRAGRLFDFVAVPNDLCAVRYHPHIGKHRTVVLGSPRYNDDWIKTVRQYVTPYEWPEAEGKLKVSLFLRSISYPIHWDEVERTIELLTQFPDVRLIVRHHTRDAQLDRLTARHPALSLTKTKQVRIVANEVHSSSILAWSDIVLDTGTSIVFEAVKARKSVLAMEYLHATRTTIAWYMPGSALYCRDDLYNVIARATNGETITGASEEEQLQFVSEVIDARSVNPLDDYAEFIQSVLQGDKTSFHGSPD